MHRKREMVEIALQMNVNIERCRLYEQKPVRIVMNQIPILHAKTCCADSELVALLYISICVFCETSKCVQRDAYGMARSAEQLYIWKALVRAASATLRSELTSRLVSFSLSYFGDGV